jgi:hypothetical protein
MDESPIFIRTYDFLVWLLPFTLKFPREQRFVLAKRLQDAALNFYEAITAAVMGVDPMANLAQADVELQRLRTYLRLSHRMKLASDGQYEHAARMVTEMGNILGGWKKSLAVPRKGVDASRRPSYNTEAAP